MNRMAVAEAASFLHGQDRRHRQGWEQTRLLGALVHKVLTGNDWEPHFPWDDEMKAYAEDEATGEQEFRNLRSFARHLETFVNKKGNL